MNSEYYLNLYINIHYLNYYPNILNINTRYIFSSAISPIYIFNIAVAQVSTTNKLPYNQQNSRGWKLLEKGEYYKIHNIITELYVLAVIEDSPIQFYIIK